VAAHRRLAGAVSDRRVPLNLITGFLGVGKTTAVRHLLANKPAGEFWAVLVNEFGEVGIDGAAISGAADGLNVVEVPGGCICCVTSPMLRVSITKLLRERRPDRLLIEPSGLGHPTGIIDLLREPMLAKVLDIGPVITLVDPRSLDDVRYTSNETWRDQIALADVLVANKCDRADADQVDRFLALANSMFPAKLAVRTTLHGQIDLDLLDLRDTSRYRPARPLSLASAGTVQQASMGWSWPPEQRFRANALAELFQRLGDHAALDLPPLLRAKGVFHTDHGWLLYNWVGGEASATDIAWRRDSRCEVIVAAESGNWSRLEAQLAECMIAAA